MAEPYRGILGPVLGQVEAIKSARSNRAMDELQAKYLGERIGLQQQEAQQQSAAEQARADTEYAANIFGAVAQSPNKRDAAQRLIVSNPRFQEITRRLQLGDFSRIDDMADEQIASGALDNFRALGGLLPQDPSQEVAARHGAVLKEIEARTAAERQLQQQQHGFELEQIGARQQAGGYRPATPEEKQALGVAADVPAEMGPEGQFRPISIPTAGGARPLTEGDKRNTLMFQSMVNAERDIENLAASGETADTSSIWNAMLGRAGMAAAQSDAFKQYEAAGLRWAANQLYLKSGATATPDEIRSTWKQYFPQPGEGADVAKQKALARQQEMQSAAQITNQPPPEFGGGGLPQGVTEEQVQHTMQKYGVTREEVLRRISAR